MLRRGNFCYNLQRLVEPRKYAEWLRVARSPQNVALIVEAMHLRRVRGSAGRLDFRSNMP